MSEGRKQILVPMAPHLEASHTGSPLRAGSHPISVWMRKRALQGDHTGKGSGGEFEPRVSGFHVHGLSVTPTLLTNKMSLAGEGEGAFACLYLLLHLCVLTKVLDIKSEIKSGE